MGFAKDATQVVKGKMQKTDGNIDIERGRFICGNLKKVEGTINEKVGSAKLKSREKLHDAV